MITFSKQENGVLFTFENSDKYLYGDGTILVPFNSLSIIQDESDMITLRKSASWDIFLSGRFDTDFGYASKEEAVNALKEILYDEAGISEEEVQQMIDAATSGIPSSQVIEQLRTDVNAVSGEVDTLQDDVASKADESSLTAVNDALTAHTANTNIHVTSTDKSNWDAKQDALTAGENITISGNVISAEAGNNIIELTQEEYDALTEKDPDALYIITDAQEINMNDYATKTDLAAKADASALTAVSGDVTSLSGDIDALQGDVTALSGQVATLSNEVTAKADTSAVTAVASDISTVSGQVATKVAITDFNAYSAATDARIAEDEEVTAAALNDLAETVSGKQDTLISGENIKTINNISILGEGNITVSGGGGGDYQYYSEDTTNESAKIEVGHQSLSVDGNGVYVNGDTVVTEGYLQDYVTSEDLEDNYYTQQVIDEKEEVIASALTELNLRVTEDEEVTAAALNNLDENKQDALEYYSEDTSGKTANIHIEDAENSTQGDLFVYGDGAQMTGSRNDSDEGIDYFSSINVAPEAIDIIYDKNTGDETTSAHSYLYVNENNISLEVNSNEVTTTLEVNDNGVSVNGDAVATESYVDAATSGKADTSAVTAAIDAAITGKVDTSAITSSVTSASTDSEIPTAKATYDAIQAGGGGGAAYSAGTNISIANDVISVNLPIEKKHFWNGDGIAIIGNANAFSDAAYSAGIGLSNTISASRAFILGTYCQAKAQYSVALNANNIANAQFSLAANRNTTTNNVAEAAFGAYNNSVTGSTASGQTLFSVGNGTSSASHNAFEIRQNGDIYVNDGTNDVRLQDTILALGGLKLVKLTQAEYDSMVTKDSSTLYIISD